MSASPRDVKHQPICLLKMGPSLMAFFKSRRCVETGIMTSPWCQGVWQAILNTLSRGQHNKYNDEESKSYTTGMTLWFLARVGVPEPFADGDRTPSCCRSRESVRTRLVTTNGLLFALAWEKLATSRKLTTCMCAVYRLVRARRYSHTAPSGARNASIMYKASFLAEIRRYCS